MTKTNEWLKLGVVGKSHGLKGAFFVSGRDAPIPSTIKQIVIGLSPEKGKETRVLFSRQQGQRVVLQCDLIVTPEAVQEWIGQSLWVQRQVIPVNDDREYLWSDLYGKLVQGSDGIALGKIVTVNNYGATDVVEIQSDHQRTLALPFISLYVDMSFKGSDPVIHLVVPASTFDEAWEDRHP